jgi:hypothetical protein
MMCKNSVEKRVSELLMRERRNETRWKKKLTNWLWQKSEKRRRKTSKARMPTRDSFTSHEIMIKCETYE